MTEANSKELIVIDERSMYQGKRGPDYAQAMIVIDPAAHRKIMHWVQECLVNGSGTEVSGLMKIERVKRAIPGVDGKGIEDIHVTDAVLLPQECSGGYTEMTEEGLSAFLVPLMQKDEHTKWSGWWHSHNDFSVFFSGIDEATAMKHQFPVSVVFNRYGQMYGQFNRGYLSNEAVVVTRPLDIESKERTEAANEIKAKVKEYRYVKFRKTKRYFRSGNYGADDGFAYRGRSSGKFHSSDFGENGYRYD